MMIPANAEKINPDTIDTLNQIEDKIRQEMKIKSQMSETEKNAFDYWCLNDYLSKITYAKLDEGYVDPISVEKQNMIIKMMTEKYSSNENFSFFIDNPRSFQVWFDSDIFFLSMDANTPLKMSKAQEILDDYDVVIFRNIILHNTSFHNSCHTVFEGFGFNYVNSSSYKHKPMLNVRGDVVNVFHTSISELFDRGYILMRFS